MLFSVMKFPETIIWIVQLLRRRDTAAKPRSIDWLTPLSPNSAATRIAFFIALAFDDPCVMMQTPFTPSRGAPPYSVWSRRFLKSINALRDKRAPTCRVMVTFRDSFKRRTDQVRYALRNLQGNVAHEPVGNDDINLSVVEVAAFHVAYEIQREMLE